MRKLLIAVAAAGLWACNGGGSGDSDGGVFGDGGPQPEAEPAPQPEGEPAPQPEGEPAPQPEGEPAPQPEPEPEGPWDPEANGSVLFDPIMNGPDQPLRGVVDLHTHPMSHLAFGGKLIHGAPDINVDMPAGTYMCNEMPLDLSEIGLSEEERTAIALGHSNNTHGGPGLDNQCGDGQRNLIVNVMTDILGARHEHGPQSGGYPGFREWPTWDDITHQHMWVDWVRRAHAGGMRVMVALAHNNPTLAQAIHGDGPHDDIAVGDAQIEAIIEWVDNADFMEIARTSDELRDIVERDKLAVVLGVEMDDLGNFAAGSAPNEGAIRREIQRLHGLGVRYAFLVHLADNHFGGTAIYNDIFAVANRFQTGRWWDLRCSTEVGHRFELVGELVDFIVQVGQFFDLGDGDRPSVPECLPAEGHVNARRMTRQGYIAADEMMRQGIMIDVDHMSIATITGMLDRAEAVGYPVNSGHNGMRGPNGSENGRTPDQYARIAALGGMAGVGWQNQTAQGWLNNAQAVRDAMDGAAVGFGTDINSLVTSPPPRGGSMVDYSVFPQARMGARTWDYNEEGVAHYGLVPDYMRDMELLGGTDMVDSLFDGAERFAQMWALSEAVSQNVPALPGCSDDPDTLCIEDLELGPFCPGLVRGDAEFDGNGPLMTATARLELSEDQRRLYAVMTMRALEVNRNGEPVADPTEAFGEWEVLLAEAPANLPLRYIAEVISPTESSTQQMSPAAGFEVIVPGDGNVGNLGQADADALEALVNTFVLVGDTGGNDVSGDGNCGQDTRMTVRFNPIAIRWDDRPEPPVGQEITIAEVNGIGPFCAMHTIRGDLEFDGHGPEIDANVRLDITENQRQIVATVGMTAQEVRGDTYGEGEWQRVIYQVPAGQRIVEILSTTETGISFVSAAAGPQFIGAIGDENSPRVDPNQDLVREFVIVGDTGGDDLSDDANCMDDTRISVSFHDLQIVLEDIPEPPPNAFEQEVRLDTIGPFCDLELLRGDREFGGNGPRVTASVTLAPSFDNARSLIARVNFRAQEVGGDTIAEGNWDVEVYTAPAGTTIAEVLSDTQSSASYVSQGHGVNVIQGDRLVGNAAARFEIVGDTNGGDVSNDRNCNDDSRMSVVFNPVQLLLRRD